MNFPPDRDRRDSRRGEPGRPSSFGVVRRDDSADFPEDSSFQSVLAEFKTRWGRGETARAEEYLDRIAGGRGAAVVVLVYQEYCLAASAGLDPDPADYLRRFPDQGDSLHRLFELHRTFDSNALRAFFEPVELPSPGDEIGPYRLGRELGKGGFARVFLAEQADLDHRLVVVKVSHQITPEPRLLARSQHPHIVEVLWHGLADDGLLQLIAMPFLGGATLSEVMAERRRVGGKLALGRDLLALLDRVSAAEYRTAQPSLPVRDLLAPLPYARAVAWCVARLAEALEHAFARGVAHGDVKPSNILLTAAGQPMLFDFNLAVDRPLADGAKSSVDAGGTLVYMAPERLRALADARPARGVAGPKLDRHCADLYSLGMVLLDALSERTLELRDGRARGQKEQAAAYAEARARGGDALIRSARASIPPTLRAILHRCLAPDPADRYRRGSELAEDLDRWRTDRSLAFAREPSWRVGPLRWAGRQRRALAACAGFAALIAIALMVVSMTLQSGFREEALSKLALNWDHADSSVFRFHRFGHFGTEAHGDPAVEAQHHLDRYGVLENANWRRQVDFRALPDAERADLEVWILEQALRYAQALEERPDSPADWQRGLALLEPMIVDATLTPLEHQARRLRRKLGLPEVAETPRETARTRFELDWMEEYLFGVEAEPTRPTAALAHYESALKSNPVSFWAHSRASSVAFRLGIFPLATRHLKACIERRPKNAALHGQLAGCLFELSRYDEALEECNRALALEPDDAQWYSSRTFIRVKLEQLSDMRSDLDRFKLLTRGRGRAESAKLGLELGFFAASKNGAIADPWNDDLSRDLSSIDPEDCDLRTASALFLWKSGRLDDALRELDLILDQYPDHLWARYSRATLLDSRATLHGQKRSKAALDDYRAVVAHPRIEVLLRKEEKAVRAFHHVSLAYLEEGRDDEALRVAKEGLALANQLAWRCRGESHYAVARSYAAMSKSNPDRIDQVLDHLRKARRYNSTILDMWYPGDAKFAAIRQTLAPRLADGDSKAP